MAFVVFGTISGTNDQETFGMKQGTEKKKYQLAVLRDRNGDLKKEWYVEFYVWNEQPDKLVRKRVKIPLSFKDKKSRIDQGNHLISKINGLLKAGFHYTIQTQKEVFLPPTIDLEENNKNILITSLDFALSVTKSSLKEKSIITYQSAINKLDYFLGNKIIDLQKFTSKDANALCHLPSTNQLFCKISSYNMGIFLFTCL